MGHRFGEIAFTPDVRSVQERLGSRSHYARLDAGPVHHERLGDDEAVFIAERDSFFIASVGETGWPYVQHRGGPTGFVRVLDPSTIGFADFRGNRQYVTLGNLQRENRVAMIFVDYATRRRLKLFGHARTVTSDDDPGLVDSLRTPGYRAHVERGIVIAVAAFDWNCPQHITPRYTREEVADAVAPLQRRVAELEARLRELGHEPGHAVTG